MSGNKGKGGHFLSGSLCPRLFFFCARLFTCVNTFSSHSVSLREEQLFPPLQVRQTERLSNLFKDQSVSRRSGIQTPEPILTAVLCCFPIFSIMFIIFATQLLLLFLISYMKKPRFKEGSELPQVKQPVSGRAET